MAFDYKKKTVQDTSALDFLKERIKEKALSGMYLFYGEEEYLKRFYFSELKKASGDETNVTVIDADDFSFEKLFDAVNTVASFDYTDSFFADEPQTESSIRVIKLYAPDLSKLSNSEKDTLLQLADNFPSGVCAVFYYPHNPKKEKEYAKSKKILSESASVLSVEFALYPPTSPLLKKWVKRHFDANKCSVDMQTLDYFITAVGNDMSTLVSETEKLCSFLSSRSEKTVYITDIDAVCIRNDTARLDDVARGAIEGNYGKAISAFSVLRAEKMPETYIFGAISNKVSELSTVEYYKTKGLSVPDISAKTGIRDFVVKNDFRLIENLKNRRKTKYLNITDAYTAIVAEYDIKIKSSAVDKYLLLENMIFKISSVR